MYKVQVEDVDPTNRFSAALKWSDYYDVQSKKLLVFSSYEEAQIVATDCLMGGRVVEASESEVDKGIRYSKVKDRNFGG